MPYRGTVTSERVAVGSKSERQAVKLVTAEGTYLLRRRDGNAFRDSTLEALVGKTIECEGHLSGTTLIVSTWRVIG